MFSRNKTVGQTPAGADSERTSGVPSIVSPDLKVTGNLVSRGDIQVDGEVEGDIEAANLTIGENGTVHGKVTAKTVRLCGAVHGEVHGETVTLAATARMVGDVVHESLAIEAGAHLEGHCRRRDPQKTALPPVSLMTKPKPALEERSAAKRGANGSAGAGSLQEAPGNDPKLPD